MEPAAENTVFIQNSAFAEGGWLRFDSPQAVVSTDKLADVNACLQQIERYTEQGLYAAGFIAYEAAAAFDSACQTHTARAGLPLLWFGIYGDATRISSEQLAQISDRRGNEWRPDIVRGEYESAIAQIRRHIHDGDCYQVNYTFALQSEFSGDAFEYFLHLIQAQRAAYCAYVDIGGYQICSLSPELFFALDGERITAKPMKGTIARGFYDEHDRLQRQRLQQSAKDRAENLMIVDMVRNDLGRIARAGSVETLQLFEVEQYPTVYQMTSTVSASTTASISAIFANLFPCASITGAPKIKAMEIIQRLEAQARGVYTGTIGYIAPANKVRRRAQFNVAIRTAVIDRQQSRAEYGVGGGIVWDSQADDEYRECLTKATVLTQTRPPFELLESLRWDAEQGYALPDLHLARLQSSAHYFGFPSVADRFRAVLMEHAAQLDKRYIYKVRLTLDSHGDITVGSELLQDIAGSRIALAGVAVDSSDPFLYNKTTHRRVYADALASVPDCDDVILFNEQGDVTETSIANIVIDNGRGLLTPHRDCGLLAGVLRESLLQQGAIKQARIATRALLNAQHVYLINSVRGWMPLVSTAPGVWRLTQSEYPFLTPIAGQGSHG